MSKFTLSLKCYEKALLIYILCLKFQFFKISFFGLLKFPKWLSFDSTWHGVIYSGVLGESFLKDGSPGLLTGRYKIHYGAFKMCKLKLCPIASQLSLTEEQLQIPCSLGARLLENHMWPRMTD